MDPYQRNELQIPHQYLPLIDEMTQHYSYLEKTRAVQILLPILQKSIAPLNHFEEPESLKKRTVAFCQSVCQSLPNPESLPCSFVLKKEGVPAKIFQKFLQLEEEFPNERGFKKIYKKIFAAHYLLANSELNSQKIYVSLDLNTINIWKNKWTFEEAPIWAANADARQPTPVEWNLVPSVLEIPTWITPRIEEQFSSSIDGSQWLLDSYSSYEAYRNTVPCELMLLLPCQNNEKGFNTIVSLIETYLDCDLTVQGAPHVIQKYLFVKDRIELSHDLRMQTHFCQMILYFNSGVTFDQPTGQANQKKTEFILQHGSGSKWLQAAHSTIVKPKQPPSRPSPMEDEDDGPEAEFSMHANFEGSWGRHLSGITVGEPNLVNQSFDGALFDPDNVKQTWSVCKLATDSLNLVSNPPREAVEALSDQAFLFFQMKEFSQKSLIALTTFTEKLDYLIEMCHSIPEVIASIPTTAQIDPNTQLLLAGISSSFTPTIDKLKHFVLKLSQTSPKKGSPAVNRLMDSLGKIEKRLEMLCTLEKARVTTDGGTNQSEENRRANSIFSKLKSRLPQVLSELQEHSDNALREVDSALLALNSFKICTALSKDQSALYTQDGALETIFPEAAGHPQWLHYNQARLWQSVSLHTNFERGAGAGQRPKSILSMNLYSS